MTTSNLDVFQVIADPNRRYILQLLSEESLTINSLAEYFDMSRPAVSKHIRILNESGFISIEDRGRERYCTLQQDGFREVQDWMNYFDSFWNNKLSMLQSILKKQKKGRQ